MQSHPLPIIPGTELIPGKWQLLNILGRPGVLWKCFPQRDLLPGTDSQHESHQGLTVLPTAGSGIQHLD